jgi:nicotinamidase/pyrazinamidase
MRALRDRRAPRAVFFDIDTQYDFMSPSGLLYVKGAEKIVRNLRTITALADRYAIPIVSTLDWHAPHDLEFKVFPQHCVRNTRGAAKIPVTIASKTKQYLVRKHTYDPFSNPRTAKILCRFTEAYVYGVAIDYCVKKACLAARRMGLSVYLIKDATKAVSPETGRAAIGSLRSGGVRFITTGGLKRRIV